MDKSTSTANKGEDPKAKESESKFRWSSFFAAFAGVVVGAISSFGLQNREFDRADREKLADQRAQEYSNFVDKVGSNLYLYSVMQVDRYWLSTKRYDEDFLHRSREEILSELSIFTGKYAENSNIHAQIAKARFLFKYDSTKIALKKLDASVYQLEDPHAANLSTIYKLRIGMKQAFDALIDEMGRESMSVAEWHSPRS